MKTWRRTFIEHLLGSRAGMIYYGDEAAYEVEVEKHYPWVIKEADRLTKLVEGKLAHDAVFKEVPTS